MPSDMAEYWRDVRADRKRRQPEEAEAHDPSTRPCYDWYLHSGNVHFARDRSTFTSYVPLDATTLRSVAFDQTIGAVGIGYVELQVKVSPRSNEIRTLQLRDVFHIPTAPCNGLSDMEIGIEHDLTRVFKTLAIKYEWKPLLEAGAAHKLFKRTPRFGACKFQVEDIHGENSALSPPKPPLSVQHLGASQCLEPIPQNPLNKPTYLTSSHLPLHKPATTMVLRLRLSRVSTPGGAKRHHPRYNIVLAHAQTARDSKPLEVLGTYNPIPELPVGAEPGARKVKDVKVDVSRCAYWLGVGAQPSDTVWRLLSMIGLLEPKYLPTGPQTENALKAVRFPTHEIKTPSTAPNKQSSKPKPSSSAPKRGDGPVTKAIKDNTKRKADIGAGTTSPTNPNEA
ncbi:hypothetical protein D0860_07377 [Hortaea werneckii]|uniref:Retrovirus-related Pol polyprotein from transposon TNT 1-94-like beta-barrel domain-containing protein n=1 Tax=Hortaea werneckii TaxID=91943 RepID=A0A3M7GME4_HORWE|nr:hypothetical protein D0860_07377 [Hortaea werneckii]